jgi:hypothetical protein
MFPAPESRVSIHLRASQAVGGSALRASNLQINGLDMARRGKFYAAVAQSARPAELIFIGEDVTHRG